MIWSQLRKQIRSLICEELRDRVDFHRAVYRKSHDGMYDHAYITVDGVKVYELSLGVWTQAWRSEMSAGEQKHPKENWRERSIRAYTTVKEAGVKDATFLGSSLHRYLEAPVDESLRSGNPLIRALAIIDRRTGKRSLAKVTLAPDEEPLVKAFFELRMGLTHK